MSDISQLFNFSNSRNFGFFISTSIFYTSKTLAGGGLLALLSSGAEKDFSD